MKEIIYYKTIEGKCPFLEWLQKQGIIEQNRIRQRLLRIQDNNLGDYKVLKNSELSELRIMTNKGYRIYFKEIKNLLILILAGSDKSNQIQTIKKANKYYEDFKERYK